MADIATTARPYARAAFEAAQQANSLPAWGELLQRASEVVGDARVTPLIGSPRVKSAELVAFIAELAGATTDPQRNFLALLAENGRLALLPEITAQYAIMRDEAEGEAHVQVSTALALTPGQLAALEATLTARFKRRVHLEQTLDASLVGGAVVRYGDLVFDGSLRGRVERLAQSMTAA
ncbi:MAG TPA: F0F1 ATP synthase subunit delta [Steroidobacteraceae bacterium]|nr:F0F1 ATP synthase subunit delta [Steroidobacteraceae bacterium]